MKNSKELENASFRLSVQAKPVFINRLNLKIGYFLFFLILFSCTRSTNETSQSQTITDVSEENIDSNIMQAKLPSLYQNLTFINGKCKKESIVVIVRDIGRAGPDKEEINAIDSTLLSGSDTSLGFDFDGDEYYIPIDKKILNNVFGYYHIGDTISIDIVFLSQKYRNEMEYLGYVTSIQKQK